ncbi:MAG: F0F1 ATP synthase subunit alpha [Candidatus Omnitrophota bacterium]
MSAITIKETGRVRAVKKIIARVSGLSNFMNGQLVNFGEGSATKGLIMGFQEDDILVLILGEESRVRIGQEVYSVQEEFRIPVGGGFLGRIVNALGEPVDGKGPIASCVVRHASCVMRPASCEKTQDAQRTAQDAQRIAQDTYPVFRAAPETMDRGEADSFLETGTKIIDAIIPISNGQRQLIIGDRMTGKTTVALDAILHQKDKDVICIYCCIGKSFSSLLKAARLLKLKAALDYTIVVAATASATVGEQYLSPYSAAALAEYFMHKGRDVLLVFDDMTKHAWSYRQLSLLLERPPGREAYPGDIYYIHSQLIERAGKLNKESGGGSITLFPIIDTLQGDITGFIPSNFISMTDGQIYLSSALFAEGFKPAIDFTLSVSIIGAKTQNPILKKLAANIRLEYAQYKELLRLTKLKSGLTAEAERKIRRGEAISALLSQDKNNPASITELIILLYALDRKILDELDMDKIVKFKNEIWGYVLKNDPELVEKLNAAKELTPELKTELDDVLVRYFKEAGSKQQG